MLLLLSIALLCVIVAAGIAWLVSWWYLRPPFGLRTEEEVTSAAGAGTPTILPARSAAVRSAFGVALPHMYAPRGTALVRGAPRSKGVAGAGGAGIGVVEKSDGAGSPYRAIEAPRPPLIAA